MIKRGILVFYHLQDEWRVWIGQQAYYIEQGYTCEIRIQNKYFQTYFEKDFDWFVTLDNDVSFVLHHHEVYKVRIKIQNFIPFCAPF